MRFSDFLLVSNPTDLDFIVGYTDDQNIRINVLDLFAGQIIGSGTAGYIPLFTSANVINDSVLYQDGSNIVIGGEDSLGYRLAIAGSLLALDGAVIESSTPGSDTFRTVGDEGNSFIIPNDSDESVWTSRRIMHAAAVLSSESATLGQVNTAISDLEGDIEILLDLKVDKSSIGEPNGVASLDATGKIPLSEIPDSIIGQVEYMGTWNAFTNTPTLNPLVPEQKGHYYVVSAAGVFGGVDYAVGDWIISNGVEWQKVDNTDAVTSVFGRIGAILPLEADYQSFYPRLSQAYDNPTWINSLAFTKITDVPPFLLENQTITLSGDVTGSGKTSISSTISNNAVSNEKLRDSVGTSVIGRADNSTGDPADIQASTDGHVLLRSAGNLLFGLISSDSISSIDWSKITGTPTTLGGYGITDAYTKTESDNKFVPYTGANTNVNLGSNNITANSFIKAGGTSSQFLKADGSVDTNNYVPTTRSVNAGTGLTGGGNLSSDITIAFDTAWGDTRYAYRTRQLTINGTTYDLSADRTWSVGTVTSISTNGPITGGIITGSGTIGITQSSASTDGYLSSTDWNTFNDKQPAGDYVTIATNQTITGLKTILRGGDVLNFKIGTDTLYGLKVAYNQNELVPSGEATWSFVNTFNNGSGTGLETTPISFFRGVLVTGQRLLSPSINANLLDYYGNNPTGRYPVYAYNTGVQQFSDKILVGFNTGVVNALTGAITDLPSGVVANFNGRVIGSNAVNSNEFVTLSQITGGFVPYTGANQTVNLNTQQLQAGHATFTTNGSTDTLTINHTSGSGRGIIVTKSGSGEGLTVVKGSGSGNAASITGGITLLTTLNLTNALADTYIASAANWNTAYNNRITSLTTAGTGGAATLVSHVLNIPQYQAQGNYITSLTGEATASGPGAASVTLTNSAVTGKVLTGLTVAGSSILSTDSILTAFGKLQGQVNDLIGGLQYQGTWNASTNTPTITSGVGTDGHFYIVSVAGNTTIDGISGWEIGDWIVFHGTAWQKVDNTESVVSVNGFTGAVTLTTSNISEGTNLYFTNSRARQAISLTTTGNSGASTYDNGTGVLNVPQYSLSGLGGVPTTRTLTINGTAFDLSADRSWSVGTVTSIATTGPIQGGTITGTGTISITQAGSASDGYLSSTDWNTFNNKQATISLTTTGNSGSSTLISNVLNVPTYTLAGLGGVPTTRTITINGLGQDLSADRTWTVGTIGGTIATGQVAFGTAANTIGGDNGLFWDNTNKRLGVGTNAPSYKAQINSAASSLTMRLQADAGINPTLSFLRGLTDVAQINGAFDGLQLNGFQVIKFDTVATERWRINIGGVFESNGAQTIRTSTGNLTLATAGGNGNILISPNGTGNVGIGTITPLARLVVSNGSSENIEFTSGSATVNGGVIQYINRSGTATTRPDLNYYLSASGLGSHKFYTSDTERWRITSTGILQSNGAQTIQTSTGNLTLATGGGNGNILLTPNGTGVALIQNTVVGNIATFRSATANGQKIDVQSTATGVRVLSGFDTGITGTFEIFAAGGNSTLSLGTNATERVRIFSSGNTFIGPSATDAGFRLDVNGTARVTSSVTASTTGTSSNFNTGAFIARAAGSSLRYTQIGYDSTGNFGWIQALEQGVAYTNLILNGVGGSVGINTTTPNASAQLDITSTTRGFLPPRMTAAQRTAIASPAEGLIVYQVDSVIGLYIYANATWRSLTMV